MYDANIKVKSTQIFARIQSATQLRLWRVRWGIHNFKLSYDRNDGHYRAEGIRFMDVEGDIHKLCHSKITNFQTPILPATTCVAQARFHYSLKPPSRVTIYGWSHTCIMTRYVNHRNYQKFKIKMQDFKSNSNRTSQCSSCSIHMHCFLTWNFENLKPR